MLSRPLVVLPCPFLCAILSLLRDALSAQRRGRVMLDALFWGRVVLNALLWGRVMLDALLWRINTHNLQ
jgi:hypothetical protein